ncbi:unnamed protein product [Phytophthora fragariaefolia]|uniref:Unnamed protein product n=1 Tax=Phytophthora fragariaefolia TaxID=1490495 RepID=A0A9W6X2X2_9STRA|nr:unnamed protein product [Phytophthora fragariaefolia]
MTARTDLYPGEAAVPIIRGKRSRVAAPTTRSTGNGPNALDIADSDNDIVASGFSSSSQGENVRDIQHMHRPLTKKGAWLFLRTTNSISDFDDNSLPRTRHRGVAFYPSPTDQRVHSVIVRQRHTGKEPQMLLQSFQHSQRIDFIATPSVLRGAHLVLDWVSQSCIFAGLAQVMRYLQRKTELTSGISPLEITCLHQLDLRVSQISLVRYHEFANNFYNKDTRKFIGVA